MTIINASNARQNFYKLLEEVNDFSDTVTITNKKGKNCVLMSEEDYQAMIETMYLYSVPGLVESILEAEKEDPKKMKKFDPDEEW